MQRTFDRYPRYDAKSLNFLIEDHFDTHKPLAFRLWKRRLWLDQGYEGACTGFTGGHLIGTSPVRTRFGVTNDYARDLYYENRRNDEWAGEDYEGSSNLGLMRTLTNRGFLKAYYSARTLNEIAHGVMQGPMALGCNIYAGMMDTDQNGFIHPTGSLLGGHAMTIGGMFPVGRYFVLFNSWGRSWGWDGAAKISFDDMERLLHEDGDAFLPKKKWKWTV
jgi:hypothetical protein